jgi:hypothetical protein
MKRVEVLLLFILVYSTGIVSSSHPKSLALPAIRSIIDEYHIKYEHELQIVSFGVKNGHADTMIEKLLKFEKQSIPISILAEIVKRNSRIELKKPSVLLFDSPENFKKIFSLAAFRQAEDKDRIPHLVYIHQAEENDIMVIEVKWALKLRGWKNLSSRNIYRFLWHQHSEIH